jgi:hypothetical protein
MYYFRIWPRETLVIVCTLVWFLLSVNTFIPGFKVELLSQCAHWNGLSMVWTLSCMVLELDIEKIFSQYAHWRLMWTLLCMVLEFDVEKLLLQYAHWYGCSLVWTLSCLILSFIHTCFCAWKICWCRWIQQLNIPGRWALEYVSKISIFFWRNWAWISRLNKSLILNLNIWWLYLQPI